jgi:hypothetical protein
LLTKTPANSLSGKSSLVEALACISVPRAAGCCTICPIEINLSGDTTSDSGFECKVYLEFKPDQPDSAEQSPAIGLSRRRDQSIQLFQITHDRTKVRCLIESAQEAILGDEQQQPDNPSMSRTVKAKFSSNIIRLDITQSGLPSLSFIDLPGIIASSDKQVRKAMSSPLTDWSKDMPMIRTPSFYYRLL